MPVDHLTPDDIERLLDGEEDGARAQRLAHVTGCPRCAEALSSASWLVEALETLDDLAPSPAFPDRVMAQVQVFEPWHAAIDRTVSPWIPRTTAGRLAAGLLIAVTGGLTTAGSLWALARADMALLLAQVGLAELRTTILAIGSDLARVIAGPEGGTQSVLASPSLRAAAVGSMVLATVLSILILGRLSGRVRESR